MVESRITPSANPTYAACPTYAAKPNTDALRLRPDDDATGRPARAADEDSAGDEHDRARHSARRARRHGLARPRTPCWCMTARVRCAAPGSPSRGSRPARGSPCASSTPGRRPVSSPGAGATQRRLPDLELARRPGEPPPRPDGRVHHPGDGSVRTMVDGRDANPPFKGVTVVFDNCLWLGLGSVFAATC